MEKSICHSQHGWRPALVTVLAALWLTACGGGDSASSISASAQAATQTSATGQTNTAEAVQTAPPVKGQTATPVRAALPAQTTAPNIEEFRVNTTTVGAQTIPAIARLKDGSHVIAWISERLSEVGGSAGVQGVCTQRYGAHGQALGQEACMAPNVAASSRPVAVALADGGYLLAWAEKQDNNNPLSNSNIWAQRIHANGSAVGSAQQINSVTSGTRATSGTRNSLLRFGLSATGLADGGYVVAWVSASTPTTGGDIFARRFDADGVPCPCGPEKQVNTFTGSLSEGSRGQPVVAALKDGGYVIVWVSMKRNEEVGSVRAQRYGAEHSSGPVGPETQLASNPLGDPFFIGAGQPAIAGLGDGGYALAYRLKSLTPDEKSFLFQVVVQPFSADGTALAAQSLVDPPLPGVPFRKCTGSRLLPNTPCPPDQHNPAIAALDDGSFVAAWTADVSSTFANESFVRRYSNKGVPLAAPSQFSAKGDNAALSPTSGGGFVVAFDEFNLFAAIPSTSEIKARYFGSQAFCDNRAP